MVSKIKQKDSQVNLGIELSPFKPSENQSISILLSPNDESHFELNQNVQIRGFVSPIRVLKLPPSTPIEAPLSNHKPSLNILSITSFSNILQLHSCEKIPNEDMKKVPSLEEKKSELKENAELNDSPTLNTQKPFEIIFDNNDISSELRCKFCMRIFKSKQALGGHMSRGHPGKNINYLLKMIKRQRNENERIKHLISKRKFYFTLGYDYDDLIKTVEGKIRAKTLMSRSKIKRIKSKITAEEIESFKYLSRGQ